MLIVNAIVITWGRPAELLTDYAILLDEVGKIVEIGPSAEMLKANPDPAPVDARGQLVLPGNICAHTHFYGAFSRGMAIPGKAPRNFPEILKKLWWPLDKSLNEKDIRYSALTCLVDAIKHGTTTLFDHHASPSFIDGSLDVIADTVVTSGLRAVLCYEVTDRNGSDQAKAGIVENVRFIKKSRNTNNPLISATFGLHAPLTLSDVTLDACRSAVPEGVGFHTHLSESKDDTNYVVENMHTRPVDWFSAHGILGPNSIAAHFVHSTEKEKEQLAGSGTWVTHQPRSNMNNGVGVSPVEDLLELGIKVCLGNDGFSNNMYEEWNAAYLLHKIQHLDPRRMNGNTVVEMAIYNNAALANNFFPLELGIIKPGAAADLIFVDYKPTTPLNSGNLPWHILFGFRGGMVTTTIVNGKFLMKDRQLTTLDEDEILNKSRELAADLWKRYESQT
jgi:putative selenium metabolism protein SsnA